MQNNRIINSFLILGAVACLPLHTGCVPGEYRSAQLPVGTRRSAAEGNGNQPNGNPAQQPEGNPAAVTSPSAGTPANTAANATPSGTTKKPTATGGVTFAPGVPDVDALKKCMNLWGTVPFKEVKPENVKVMDVAVGVGGGLLGSSSPLGSIGNLINLGNTKDLEATSAPRLVVIPLSVNLGGSTTFELMNPNGWYCIKTAVGAKSTVNIKLNCSAKLAQSDLGLNVNTQPGTGSPIPVKVGINDGTTPGGQLGIMVDSNVSLTRVSGSGAACPP